MDPERSTQIGITISCLFNGNVPLIAAGTSSSARFVEMLHLLEIPLYSQPVSSWRDTWTAVALHGCLLGTKTIE